MSASWNDDNRPLLRRAARRVFFAKANAHAATMTAPKMPPTMPPTALPEIPELGELSAAAAAAEDVVCGSCDMLLGVEEDNTCWTEDAKLYGGAVVEEAEAVVGVGNAMMLWLLLLMNVVGDGAAFVASKIGYPVKQRNNNGKCLSTYSLLLCSQLSSSW